MPGPLQQMVTALGLDDPTQPPAWSPDQLQGLSEQYPNFAQALDQNNIHLNITGPNIIGGPPPDFSSSTIPELSPEQMQQQMPGQAPPPQGPSLFDLAGSMLSKGDLNQRFANAYMTHGPQAVGKGFSHLSQAIQDSLDEQLQQGQPLGQVPWDAVRPALGETIAGAATTAMPMAYPAALLHPAHAIIGGIVASALSGGAEAGLTKLGVDPENAKFFGDLAGYIQPEHLAAAAMPFAPFARRALMEALDKEAAGHVKALLKSNPEFAGIVKWLHPSEAVALSKMTPNAQAEFLRVHEALPGNEWLGALARGGIEKLGWYENSRSAIQHVYGDEADLFAGVLASTSPQNSVEMNLLNATRIFRGWVQAGRPTDEASILRIMGENVVGEKGEKSALDAWKNNTVQVLQGGKAISGPKVDSFWRNLRNRAVQTPYGEMRNEDATTLDAWISNIFGIKQTYFAGQGASGKTPAAIAARQRQLAGMNPGYGPGYLASTARLRNAGTAAGYTPEQIQETIWSWGKALMEQAEKTGVSAVDIIKSGTLDHSAVAGTPDFSTLFNHPKYVDAIANTSADHAARLKTLQPASFPPRQPTSPSDLRWQLKSAQVLDDLIASRKLASDLRTGENIPGTVGVTIPMEGRSGGITRVAPELNTDAFTQNQRNAFARELMKSDTDVRGENVLLKALGMPTAETTTGIGHYEPEGGGPTEHNVTNVWGTRARLNPAYPKAFNDPDFMQGVAQGTEQMPSAIHPKDAADIMMAARLGGLFNAQDAVGMTGVVYDMARKDTLHIFTQNKVKQDVFEGLSKVLPGGKDGYVFVNKGGGTPGHVIDVIQKNGRPISETDQELVRGYLSQFNKDPKKLRITPGTNVAGAYLVAPWETGAGSKAVTTEALTGYDYLSKTKKAQLDGPELRNQAKAKLKVWETEGKALGLTPSSEYVSVLRLVADGGISALRRALDNPDQLLPSLLLIGLVRYAGQTPQTRNTPSS